MNSQFTNSNFGRVLYIAIISLIIVATIFVIWYMTTGYKLGTYAPDTRLGSVYIGGLTDEEIVPRLDDKVNYWYDDETIVFELSYQEYRYEFDRNLFLFDIEESIYGIKDGVTNKINVYYQGTDRETVKDIIYNLPFLSNINDNVDLELLINDILHDAQLMKSFSVKDVENYLVDPEISYMSVSSAIFPNVEVSEMSALIEKVLEVYPDGRIVIPSKELFDINNVFSLYMTDTEMTVLASAMLESILPTNFLINEVHYLPVINTMLFSRNVNVNHNSNENFSFYNPNNSDYYFELEVEEDEVYNGNLLLVGLPFEYTINLDTVYTELGYITAGTTDSGAVRDGFTGMVVEVNREIIDLDSVTVYDGMILFEFYPPGIEIIFEP